MAGSRSALSVQPDEEAESCTSRRCSQLARVPGSQMQAAHSLDSAFRSATSNTFYGFRFTGRILRTLTLPPARTAPETASSEPREALRLFSKIVFGNRDRLEVAAAIARSRDGFVNATDLQDELGIAQSRIRNQLVAFSEAGLLSAFPSSDLKRWYQRLDSSFWQACLDLYEDRMG